MGTLANCEDPDGMQQDAAFHQGLHYFGSGKNSSQFRHSTCDPLKYTMGSLIHIVSIYM